MQALRRKLVVLVQILPYNVQKQITAFARIRPPPAVPGWVTLRPSDSFSPHYFFRSAAPEL